MHEVFRRVQPFLDFRDWATLRSTCRLAVSNIGLPRRSLVQWGISEGYLYYGIHPPHTVTRHDETIKLIRMGSRLLRVPTRLSTQVPRWDYNVIQGESGMTTGPYLGYHDIIHVAGGGNIVIVSSTSHTAVHHVKSGFYTVATRHKLSRIAYWPDSDFFYGYCIDMGRIVRYSAIVPNSSPSTYRWHFPTCIDKFAVNGAGLVTLRFGTHTSVWVTLDSCSTELAQIDGVSRSVQAVHVLDGGFVFIVHGTGMLSVVESDLKSMRMLRFPIVGNYLFHFGDTVVTTHMVINVRTKRSYHSRFLTNCRQGIVVNGCCVLQDWLGTCKYYY